MMCMMSFGCSRFKASGNVLFALFQRVYFFFGDESSIINSSGNVSLALSQTTCFLFSVSSTLSASGSLLLGVFFFGESCIVNSSGNVSLAVSETVFLLFVVSSTFSVAGNFSFSLLHIAFFFFFFGGSTSYCNVYLSSITIEFFVFSTSLHTTLLVDVLELFSIFGICKNSSRNRILIYSKSWALGK
jgi:hypothetical protein